jgi:hypothetical protein
VACDGTIKRERQKPASNYWHQMIGAPAFHQFGSAEVNFVVIKNLRTCAEERIDVSGIPTSAKSAYIEAGGIKYETKSSALNSDGDIRIYATDSNIKVAEVAMGFAAGNNLLKIEYFGECEEYKAEKDQNPKLHDANNCLRAKPLYDYAQLVIVSTTEKVVPEVPQVDVCQPAPTADVTASK